MPIEAEGELFQIDFNVFRRRGSLMANASEAAKRMEKARRIRATGTEGALNGERQRHAV
jgi:hypothetical protein